MSMKTPRKSPENHNSVPPSTCIIEKVLDEDRVVMQVRVFKDTGFCDILGPSNTLAEIYSLCYEYGIHDPQEIPIVDRRED